MIFYWLKTTYLESVCHVLNDCFTINCLVSAWQLSDGCLTTAWLPEVAQKQQSGYILLKKGELEQNIWWDETMAGLLMRLCLLVGLAQPKNMRHKRLYLKRPWEIIIRFYIYELRIGRNGIGKKTYPFIFHAALDSRVGQESFVKVNNLLNQKHVQTAV